MTKDQITVGRLLLSLLENVRLGGFGPANEEQYMIAKRELQNLLDEAPE